MKEYSGERTIVIRAPIEAVYDYVSDFPRHVEWNYTLVEMTKMSDGPLGVGSVFRTKERVGRSQPWMIKLLWPALGVLFGTTGYTEAEITALEPNRRVAWKAAAPLKNGEFMAKSEWELRLESQGDATRITQHFHYMFSGKMGERVDPDKGIQDNNQEIDKNLVYLQGLLESQRVHEAPTARTVAA